MSTKKTTKAAKKKTTEAVPRGLTARWHCNQAMRIACEALADKLRTKPGTLPEYYTWEDAKSAMRAIEALKPLVFEMNGQTFIEHGGAGR